MSTRSRLPDSLRWRAVRWMEMGLSQTDAARRLNVSRSVVQRLWAQYQSEDSLSRRHVSGRPRVTTPAEDRFLALCAAARCRPLFSIREKNLCYYRRRLHNAGLYARRSAMSPSTDDREAPAYVGQENTFTVPDSNGLLYSSQTSSDSHCRAIQGVCLSGGINVPDITNPPFLKGTVTEVVESWFGQGSGGHTDLHV
ncbi:hypothetical protein AVEN_119029-1, partial [Araneus ventricosus]